MSLPNIRVSVDAVVFGYDSKEGLSVLLIKRKIAPYGASGHCLAAWCKKLNRSKRLYNANCAKKPASPSTISNNSTPLAHPDATPATAWSRSHITAWCANPNLTSTQPPMPPPPSGFAPTKSQNSPSTTSKSSPLPPPDCAANSPTNTLNAFQLDASETATTRLRGKLAYEPIGFELLDEKFRFSDLHQLYETIYGHEMERRNFKKKFLKLGILEEQAEKVSEGRGRPGALFKFDKKKYFALKEKGMLFQI